jgi:hypothetical protein
MLYQKLNILKGREFARAKEARQAYAESLRGSQGEAGEAGAPGSVGQMGQRGERGYNGPKGLQGESGRDGARGPMGPAGRDGVDGKHGRDGEDGKDGRGIERAYLDRGNLHIVYTDGDDVNLGLVQGAQGIRGPSGRSGGVFGDTTENITNITEEVLDAEDKANLQTLADNSTEKKITDKEQMLRIERELKYIKAHLNIVSDEKITDQDIERDEQ